MKYPTNIYRYFIWLASIGLVVWILTRLPIEAMLQAISSLDIFQWLAWIVINFLIITVFVWRWLILTQAIELSCKFFQLFRVRQAGQLISFVTPGPQFGGEPLQVYWLWRRYSVPGPAAILAVGLDRYYELSINFSVLLLAVLILLTSVSVAFVNWYILAIILLSLIVAMGLGVGLLLRKPDHIRIWAGRLTSRWQNHPRLSRLKTHWWQLNKSLQQVVTHKRAALRIALVLSVLAWAAMIVEFWLLLTFIDVPLSPTTFIFLFTVVRLAFLLPLPGGLGSVEASLFWAFQVLALPLAEAGGLILMMRLRDLIILLTGALVLPGLQSASGDAGETETQ